MSLKVIKTKQAAKSAADLPSRIQDKFATQLSRLEDDRRDPRLHLKKLSGPEDRYSFRITRSYCALFYFHTSDTVVIFAIGHRKDIYK
jgi:mRNA-degrading endonuclease RelE of RelBE toxin-antitoxin system